MPPRVRSFGIAETPSRPLFIVADWPLEEVVFMWEATTGHSTHSVSRWNIELEEIDEPTIDFADNRRDAEKQRDL
jgi:hypothetical protein